MGEGRLNRLTANQQHHHERLQPTTDLHRESPDPKLPLAEQLGAATASALTTAVQSQLHHRPSRKVPVPLTGGHTWNWLFPFAVPWVLSICKIGFWQLNCCENVTGDFCQSRQEPSSFWERWSVQRQSGAELQGQQTWKPLCCGGHPQGCQGGKGDEAGCCFSCSGSGAKLLPYKNLGSLKKSSF